ncbi:MAG TPA: hypothetical protein VNA28_05995 [Solirubrobacteraceae bacterium]|nr:hypothetical protein [Solirubrobacteraceae bacterium]
MLSPGTLPQPRSHGVIQLSVGDLRLLAPQALTQHLLTEIMKLQRSAKACGGIVGHLVIVPASASGSNGADLAVDPRAPAAETPMARTILRYAFTMPTLVLGSPPPELEALMERRRLAGVIAWTRCGRVSATWCSGPASSTRCLHAADAPARRVDEVLIVDPPQRTVTWLGLRAGEYEPVARSGLIELGPVELAEQLDWPWRQPRRTERVPRKAQRASAASGAPQPDSDVGGGTR